MEIKILYEDEFILALDKPSGVLVHEDGKSAEETLVEWIVKNRPEIKEVGEEQRLQNGQVISRPGIVHRLDRETSGVIIVAKTQESYDFFKKQFQDREIEKTYNAVVWGNFSAEKMAGIIDKPIGRSAGDFRKWSAEYGAKGEMREAITEYRVIAQTKQDAETYTDIERSSKINVSREGVAYLEVKPKTGRTHQIRVHLKAIGHPVLGDKLYGRKTDNEVKINSQGKIQLLKFDRLALHALSIKLKLPDHTYINIESELPEQFRNTLNLLKNRIN
jgi:23S rRNA pseudouridine1911/1915/1917 synthase